MIGIYKITNPSGKIYIGQSINIYNRWDKYIKHVESCKSQTKLYYSFKKHGFKKHIFEVIEECSENQLLERETYWKNYYQVLDKPSLCCRIDGKGGKNSKSTNYKISKSAKKIGVGKWNKGRIQSTEEKLLRSKIRIGYKPSESHIKNMRKGMINKNTVKIICINTNEVFNSIKEAADKYKICTSSIDNILSGKAIKTRKDKLKFKYY